MAVSAAFKVTKVTGPFEYGKKEDGSDYVQADIEMTPDYAEGRNKEWAKWTPAGVFRITTQNSDVIADLPEGTSVKILIQPE